MYVNELGRGPQYKEPRFLAASSTSLGGCPALSGVRLKGEKVAFDSFLREFIARFAMVPPMSVNSRPIVTLEVRDLSARRGGRTIFEGLSFSLKNSQSMTVVGSNGSGKSTLLRILAGLLRAETGAVLLQPDDGSTVCFAGHRDGLKGALTVRENLAFWSKVYAADAGAVDSAIDRMALEAVIDMPADMLSAGWRRRAGLARLALDTAAIWIVDEPYTALDTENVERIDDLLATHVASGGVVIMATHQSPSFAPTRRLDMTAYPAKRPEGLEMDW